MTKLLVIRFSALGDVAMLAPIVRQAALLCPDIDITMLSGNRLAPLFEGQPSNIHFVGADFKGRHKGIKGLNTLLQDIDYQQFDIIADLHNVLRSHYLDIRFLLAGKKVNQLRKHRLIRWWLTSAWNKNKRAIRSTPENYCQVLSQALSLPNQLLFHSLLENHHLQTIEQNRETYLKIGIAPFAAHQGKIYPIEKMEKVIALLSQSKDIDTIYLFGGGEKEKKILSSWAAQYKHTKSVAGTMPMSEELQLMQSLHLMVSMDSGNMHMASLVGTRVISIWGATHPMAGFLGIGQAEKDCIQRNLPCRPCSIYGNKHCRWGDYRCLAIAPEKIVQHIIAAYK